MKALLDKIRENDKSLEINKDRIETAKTLPFYSIFNREFERKRDLKEYYGYRKTLLDVRQLLLENLELEIKKELAELSQKQKENKICTLTLESPLAKS